ncbi:MAG: transporter [Thiobacillus sp.]|nr:transporter [Thiobacillus sp.]
MQPIVRSAILAGLLTLPLPALAFHPLITDDTGTQGMAGNQLEIGYDQVRSEGDTGRAIGVTYTRGVTDNLDLFAGSAWQASGPSGWGNVGIGAKWRFYENEADKVSLALKPEILLPVSASDEAAGLGNGELSYGVTFIASRETSFGELHFNAELARSNYDDSAIDERQTFWRVSVAPVWAVAEGWRLALDLGLQSNPDRAEDAVMGYVELGLVYCPNGQVDLSLGIIRDFMDGPADTTTATAEVTLHF